MKILRTLLLVLLVLVGLGVAGLYATGNGQMITFGWAYLFGGPALPFDASDAVDPPDYSDPSNWAALPDREDLADLRPEGVAASYAPGAAPVDVFFIHPTGFLRGDSWTFSMNPDTATEQNTQWMMANQASAYNGCCNVYAPRYRQANIFAYFKEDAVREEVLGFAYTDVRRAFEYFLANYNNSRPFVIASHSQGTHHGIRLLADMIDGTPLAQRMVAAFLIGGSLKTSQFTDLQDIDLCTSADDTGCGVHWDTWSEAVIERGMTQAQGNACVNPLSWTIDGGLADKALHQGAVPGSGDFQMQLSGADTPGDVEFGALGAPIPNMLQAQCKDGMLFITDQSDNGFGQAGGSFGGGNYHGLDYPIFHMDIRNNVNNRVQRWLASSG